MASMVMGSPARSSSAQLLLHFLVAYFLFCSSLDAPPHSLAAAAEDPQPPLSFSFDFSNPSSYRSEDLKFEGDATVHGTKVDLTCNSYDQTINGCTGRMSYGHPVPFYDNTTGEVASFSARFTFAIMVNNETMNNKGDGMAFFLACYPSSMPPHSGGGNLGLIGGDGTIAYDAARFVAVEFDTFPNNWDPQSTNDHIGIDISTVQDPVNTTSLPNFSLNGTMTASITFDNSTRMLVAFLEFADNPSTGTVNVSRILPEPDTLLPSEVAVGFSAATGASIELHQILSWSFSSTLPAPLHKGYAEMLFGCLYLTREKVNRLTSVGQPHALSLAEEGSLNRASFPLAWPERESCIHSARLNHPTRQPNTQKLVSTHTSQPHTDNQTHPI